MGAFMPESTFVPYPGFVSDVKKTYSKEYLKAQHALGVTVKDYKSWDKSDLITLYNSYFGRQVFNHLVALVREARREEQARANGSKTLAFAQQDLNQLAPNGLDWKGYDRLIVDTIADLKALSSQIRDDLLRRFDTPGIDRDELELTIDTAPTGAFDHQQALAALDEVTVKKSSARVLGFEMMSRLRNVVARSA